MEIQVDDLTQKRIKSFTFIRIIGKGGFSTVYQVYDQFSKNQYACKVIPKMQFQNTPKLKQLVKTQIQVLRNCNSLNVISFKDSFQNQKYIFIFIEFCNGGELQQYLDKKKQLTQTQAKYFLKQIINGFKGLHQVNALHRDFKLSNVLIHDNIAKISDLGFAKILLGNNLTTTCLGTSLTMAPQVFQGQQYGNQCDIWSLGIIYYQLLFGQYPFNGKSDFEILKCIKTKSVVFKEDYNISENSKDFIKKCLIINPKKRLSWKQIYDHPIFQKVSYERINPGEISKYIIPEEEEKQKKKKEQYNIQEVKLNQSLQYSQLKRQSQLKVKTNKMIEQSLEKLLQIRNRLILILKYGLLPISKSDKLFKQSVYAFFLCKKFYIGISQFLNKLQKQQNILNLEYQDLYHFIKCPKYQDFIERIKDDKNIIIQQSTELLSHIETYNQDILNQLTLQQQQTQKFKILFQQLFRDYFYIHIGSLQSKEIPRQNIQLLKFIQDFLKGIQQSSEKYEQKMAFLNTNKLQQAYLKQYKKSFKCN